MIVDFGQIIDVNSFDVVTAHGRVPRVSRGDKIDIKRVDCFFCGDELRDNKCARNCEASRRALEKRPPRVERQG